MSALSALGFEGEAPTNDTKADEPRIVNPRGTIWRELRRGDSPGPAEAPRNFTTKVTVLQGTGSIDWEGSRDGKAWFDLPAPGPIAYARPVIDTDATEDFLATAELVAL